MPSRLYFWRQTLSRQFTLEYWLDGQLYVGRLTEVPGVFSQGESLQQLERNIRDAYRMMLETDGDVHAGAQRTAITVDV
ncbi:MAG: type II toxin-antitoxin system HicB family antitoxin [Acidobacteriaceae bacterium]|nr:type II toxin-antitoxin system HicB family antitoxin [Acidobacteriaceae bacterium]